MVKEIKERLAASTVTRFHTDPTIQDRTIGHHSFNMMLILDWAYNGHPPIGLLRACMLHDLHERYMGDIPYPIKKNPGIEQKLKALEREFNRKLGIDYVLTEFEEQILNTIDMLEFIHYLVEEKRLGNQNNDAVFETAINAINFEEPIDTGGCTEKLFTLYNHLKEEFRD